MSEDRQKGFDYLPRVTRGEDGEDRGAYPDERRPATASAKTFSYRHPVLGASNLVRH